MGTGQLKRFMVGAMIVTALSSAPLADAAPATGGCPSGYELVGRREALRLIRSEGNSREEAQTFFETVDNNEDDQLCVQAVGGPRTTHFNYIDNNANR